MIPKTDTLPAEKGLLAGGVVQGTLPEIMRKNHGSGVHDLFVAFGLRIS